MAIAYAAEYPQFVRALVIVDMDVFPRAYEGMDLEDIAARRACPSTFDSFEEAERVLSRWYQGVDRMANDGSNRVYASPNGAQWITKNHPYTQYLFRERIMGVDGVGLETFKKLAEHNYGVFLLVASTDSSCDTTSIEKMQEAVERMEVHFVFYSTHSIHRTCPEGFRKKIEEIMEVIKEEELS